MSAGMAFEAASFIARRLDRIGLDTAEHHAGAAPRAFRPLAVELLGNCDRYRHRLFPPSIRIPPDTRFKPLSDSMSGNLHRFFSPERPLLGRPRRGRGPIPSASH